MLICNGCGELIQEDQLRRVNEPHGERFDVCPICGDTTIPASQCKCGDWYDPEDLLPGGYCEVCLCEDMTQELAEAFIKESNLWEQFLIDFWLNGREYLLDLISKFFHSKPETEQMEQLSTFIYAGAHGAHDYAFWLSERGDLNE